MGYFPNGTAGCAYQEKYCDHCVHWLPEYGCPCDTAHMLWNYDECNKEDSILHKMIPRDDKGFNLTCTFFHPNVEYKDSAKFIKSKNGRPEWGQH